MTTMMAITPMAMPDDGYPGGEGDEGLLPLGPQIPESYYGFVIHRN